MRYDFQWTFLWVKILMQSYCIKVFFHHKKKYDALRTASLLWVHAVMKFTPITLLPSGDLVLQDDEISICGEENVSVWRQEDKKLISQLYPSGTIILTNSRIAIVYKTVSSTIGLVFILKISFLFETQCIFNACLSLQGIGFEYCWLRRRLRETIQHFDKNKTVL